MRKMIRRATLLFFLFFLTSHISALNKITNYTGNEIFPVIRNGDLYFIKYQKDRISIMKRTVRGELSVIMDEFVLADGFDVSPDEDDILWISNKEDSRGSLKKYDVKRSKNIIIERGRSFEGACFIDKDNVCYSSNNQLILYSTRKKEKKKIADGRYPFKYSGGILFSCGNEVFHYMFRSGEIKIVHKNDTDVFYPVMLNDRLFFCEADNRVYMIMNGTKLPLFYDNSPVVTLNVSGSDLIAAKRDKNFDIVKFSMDGAAPLFTDEADIGDYRFSGTDEEIFALERFLALKGSNINIEKDLFVLYLRKRDYTKAGYYLELTADRVDPQLKNYFFLLTDYMKGSLNEEKYGEYLALAPKFRDSIDLLWGSYLFSGKRYEDALAVFRAVRDRARNRPVLNSAQINISSVYSKFGDIREILDLWDSFFAAAGKEDKGRFIGLLDEAFSSDLISLWEKLYFLERIRNDEDALLLKAEMLNRLGLNKNAFELIKDNEKPEAQLLKIKIAVDDRDTEVIARTLKKADREAPGIKSEIMKLLNVESIFREKDMNIIERLYTFYPNEPRMIFWYFFYLKENARDKLSIIAKNLGKNDDMYLYKRTMCDFFLEKKIPSLRMRGALGKWEEPYLLAVTGIYYFMSGNFEKAKDSLLKALNLSSNDTIYINALILSYLGKCFYSLEDYENLDYYLSMRFQQFGFFFNAEQAVNDSLILARTYNINKKYREAVDVLQKAMKYGEDLRYRIRILRYLSFLNYINGRYNDALVNVMSLIGEKEKQLGANFTMEYKLYANICLELNDNKSAEEYFLKALDELKTYKFDRKGLFDFEAFINPFGVKKADYMKDPPTAIRKEIYNGLIMVYSKLGRYADANRYLGARMAFLSKKEKKSEESAIVLNHFGLNSLREKKIDEAVKRFTDSMSILEDIKSNRGRLANLVNIYSGNFARRDFREIIPFSDYVKIVKSGNALTEGVGLSLFQRALLETQGLKEFSVSLDLEKNLDEFEKIYGNLIQLEHLIDDFLERNKDAHFKTRALLFLTKYFLAGIGGGDGRPYLEDALRTVENFPRCGLIWYFQMLAGNNVKAVDSLLNTFEKIPGSLMPAAVNLLNRKAQDLYREGDFLGFVRLKEQCRSLEFFNSVSEEDIVFSGELDNIFFKNARFLKEKLFRRDTDKDRLLLEIDEELKQNPASYVNFFIRVFTRDIKEMLGSFEGKRILFCDWAANIFVLWDGYEMLGITDTGGLKYDYAVSYNTKFVPGMANSTSLNFLYYSLVNFNYNPEMVLNVDENTAKLGGWGIINAYIEGSNVNDLRIGPLFVKALLGERQTPYHLFLRELPDYSITELLVPLLTFSGISTFSGFSDIPPERMKGENKFDVLSSPDSLFFGFRGLKKEEIPFFINSKFQYYLDLAIDAYKGKKWQLAAIYFNNLINIYGDPLEDAQKMKIFNYFIRALYMTRDYEIAVYYINKVLDGIIDPETHKDDLYRLLSNLIAIHNAMGDTEKALATAKIMQEKFAGDTGYLIPIQLSQIDVYASNGMLKKAFDLSSELYREYNSGSDTMHMSRIILNYAHYLYLFKKDPLGSLNLFEEGIRLDLEKLKGENIGPYFLEYLRNNIECGNYEIGGLIEKYSEFIDAERASAILGVACLKRRDLLKARNIAESLIKSREISDITAGYNLLGLIEFELNNLDSSGNCFKKALEYAIKSKQEGSILDIRANQCLLFMAGNEYRKALSIASEIYQKDVKTDNVANILYDLRLIAVCKSRLGIKASDEIKILEEMARTYDYEDYYYFAQYRKAKAEKPEKATAALRELLGKNISGVLRVELLNDLSSSEPELTENLFEEFLKLGNIASLDIIKNGLTFSKEGILKKYFLSANPAEALTGYYSDILKERYSREEVEEALEQYSFNACQIVLLDGLIFTFRIKNGRISMTSRAFDAEEYALNFHSLFSDIAGFTEFDHAKGYFSDLFFSDIPEKDITLIPDRRTALFPFSIFEDRKIGLYSVPFSLKRKAVEDNGPYFFSEDAPYLTDLAGHFGASGMAVLKRGFFNGIEPFLSSYPGVPFRKAADLAMLVISGIEPAAVGYDVIPSFYSNENSLFIFCPWDDMNFYSILIRLLIRNGSDLGAAAAAMKEKFKFPRYYALASLIKTKFR